MADTSQDLPPVKSEDRRVERREDRRPPKRGPSAVRRVFTELVIYLTLVAAGALLAVVLSYLLSKFGF